MTPPPLSYPAHVPLHACGLPPPPPACAGPPPPEAHNGRARVQQPRERFVLAFVWGVGWVVTRVCAARAHIASSAPPQPDPPHLCTLAGCLRLRGALALCLLLRRTTTQCTHKQAKTQPEYRGGGGRTVHARENMPPAHTHTHARTQVTGYGAAANVPQARRGRVRTRHTGARTRCARTSTVHVAEGGICHGAECGCVRGS
jgi:hypothetical protein